MHKTSASTNCAPVQLLLELWATLITAHAGVTDHTPAYLLILHCDEPSMKIHIGYLCLDRGQSQKHTPSTTPPWIHRQKFSRQSVCIPELIKSFQSYCGWYFYIFVQSDSYTVSHRQSFPWWPVSQATGGWVAFSHHLNKNINICSPTTFQDSQKLNLRTRF